MARSSYALGLLTFGLLASTSIVSPVRAETASAKTSWTINKVASAAAGSYCTMAQKYSDNTILTLAKNGGGQYSLAFDFAKPQFSGASATVSLRPGNASAQTFNVSPTSDKVIVIGLGTGTSFVDALKTTGKLDLEANGKAFSFKTEEFASAADELSGCIGTMKAPAMAAASPAPVQAQTAPTKVAAVETPRMISNPDAEKIEPLAGSSAEITNLQAENAQLKQALVQTRQTYEARESSAQTAMASELQEKINTLQQENNVLKAQGSVSGDVSKELAKTKAELVAAQALAQSLASQQKTADESLKQVSELQKQNMEMKAQLQAANTSVAQLQAKAVQGASTSEQLALMQKQNEQIQGQLSAANVSMAQLQAKAAQGASVSEQLSMLQKQNMEMKTQLETANKSVAELQVKNVQANAVSSQIAVLQKQNSEMKTQLDSANANVAQFQTKAAKGTEAAAQVALLQKQTADMKVQLDAANASVAQLQTKAAQGTSSAEQLAVMQKQNAEMKTQLEAANANVAQLQTKAAQGTSSAEQLAMLQKQNAEMKTQLDAANANVAQMQTKLAQAPAAPVVDPAAIKENESLKLQVAALQSAAAQKPIVDDSAPVISSLKTENTSLRQQLAAAQSAKPVVQAVSNDEIKNLQNQLEIAQAENTTLKDQLDKATTTTNIAQAGANSFDLEQATKRYQESQREIRRLGSLVQKEQLLRKQEKEEMEAKLFDPAITDEQQRAKLDELQRRIAELEGKDPSSIVASARAVPVPEVEAEAQPMEVSSIKPAAGIPDKSTPIVEAKPIAKPTAPVASAVISPMASVNFQSPEDFAQMLNAAGINIRGDVENVETGSSDSYRAYRWKTDSLFGSVEQRAMKGGKGFDTAVNDYLERAKSRCAGDFAAVPSEVTSSADQVKSYEIACIGTKSNTSASVMFTYGNNVMMTLAHEGKAEAMDLAMEARDRMASQMSHIKTASK